VIISIGQDDNLYEFDAIETLVNAYENKVR
jgi:hypothetical protein